MKSRFDGGWVGDAGPTAVLCLAKLVVVHVKIGSSRKPFNFNIRMKENVKCKIEMFHLLSVQEYATCLGNVNCRLKSILIF